MTVTRRNMLMSTLFGAGYVGLRSLVTGLPAAFFLEGRQAFADMAPPTNPQYFIVQTSGNGDPLNANVPGTYATSGPLAGIYHSPDPTLAATALSLRGAQTTAALPWAQLPQNVLDRTTFWHLMTNTPVHPKEPDVLSLFGATVPNEMLPSLLARELAASLGTVQQQPITLGATSPSEGLTFNGQALPIIPPLALKATLTNPTGPLAGLTKLQKLRDTTLAQLDDVIRGSATTAQKAYLDSLITSRDQVRSINQSLLTALATIKGNSVADQITAAIVLIQMKVTPVIAIHIPFGGDNHTDTALVKEAAETVSGVAAIGSLMTQLQTANLFDKVSFLSLNVFGRTLGANSTDGRQHNDKHQVSLAIGKPFAGGVIGGIGPIGTDFGCLAINSQTGAPDGDIAPKDTLASFGKTVMAAAGIDSALTNSAIVSGTVVKAALA